VEQGPGTDFMARQPPLTEARDALCASLLKPPPQTVIRVLRLAMLVPPGAPPVMYCRQVGIPFPPNNTVTVTRNICGLAPSPRPAPCGNYLQAHAQPADAARWRGTREACPPSPGPRGTDSCRKPPVCLRFAAARGGQVAGRRARMGQNGPGWARMSAQRQAGGASTTARGAGWVVRGVWFVWASA